MNYNVIGPDGASYGPVDLDTLKRWAVENRVLPTTMIEEIGSGRRFAAGTMANMFPSDQGSTGSGVLHPGYDNVQQTPAGPVRPAPGGAPSGATYSQATAYASAIPQEPVNNRLIKAILSLFCFLPLGIVALVFSLQVGTKQAEGDYYGARQSANTANICSNIAIGLGLLGCVSYIALVVVGLSFMKGSPGTLPAQRNIQQPMNR